MLDKNLYQFYISYRIDGEVHLAWMEGINLRHAKDKVLFNNPEATDLMDWTNERKEDLEHYLRKMKAASQVVIKKSNSGSE